jgi:hypothetical protein
LSKKLVLVYGERWQPWISPRWVRRLDSACRKAQFMILLGTGTSCFPLKSLRTASCRLKAGGTSCFILKF